MTEELTIYKESKSELSTGNEMYLDVDKFEQAQRVAKMLASSTMVPEHFRNNVGNCMIGLNFASRVGLDPFMVLQKMYVIKGRPGIESQLMIALVNSSGMFTPLKFRIEGEGKTLKCTCYATERASGEECAQTVSWDMVTAEGWDKKPGSKWKTMPSLMLQYRSAAFFGRLYCPGALLGMMSKEELHDITGPTLNNATSIAGRIKPMKATPETSTTDAIEVSEKQPNQLHKTEEWAKYKEACGIAPEIAATMPEPTTEEQCTQAVTQINKLIDAQNK